MSDQRFAKQLRLLTSDQFRRAFKSGIYAADRTLVCNATENGLAYSRLGLSISRKVGNAVVRNRWKRAIREAFRRSRHRLPQGFDFVFRPKAGAAFEAKQVDQSVQSLAIRAEKRARK